MPNTPSMAMSKARLLLEKAPTQHRTMMVGIRMALDTVSSRTKPRIPTYSIRIMKTLAMIMAANTVYTQARVVHKQQGAGLDA